MSVLLFKYFEPVKDKAKSKCSDERSIALSLSNKDKNRVSRVQINNNFRRVTIYQRQ